MIVLGTFISCEKPFVEDTNKLFIERHSKTTKKNLNENKFVLRSHGNAAEYNRKQCSECHKESECSQCHLEQPPANHNVLFKSRTHGMKARMDREKCSVCHQQNMCDQCHESTKPISHTNAYINKPTSIQGHCNNCHEPISSSNCVICHKITVHPSKIIYLFRE